MDKNSKDQSGQTPCHEASSNGHLEVCRLFMECVTTHLPKQLSLKMDGAKASHLYSAVQLELALEVLTTERVGRSLG